MSFSDYYREEFEAKTPTPHKTKVTINLSEYKDIVLESILTSDKKNLLRKITDEKGEIPIFCKESNKFFMCDFTSKKKRTREVKSREDKAACGTLLNGMIVTEYRKGNEKKIEELKQIQLNWEVPSYVYKCEH